MIDEAQRPDMSNVYRDSEAEPSKPKRTRRAAANRATPEELEARQAAIDSLDFGLMLDELEPPKDTVLQLSPAVKAAAGLDDDAVFVIPADNGKPAFTVEGLQLTFPVGTPYEVWERDALRLIAMGKRITWYIADALAFGEDAFGEKHAQVYDLTSWSKQTLKNITYIAKAIPPERRRDDLEFGVQAAVASLSPEKQREVLQAAADNDWGREQVRQAVNSIRRVEKLEAAKLKVQAEPLPVTIVIEQGDARLTRLGDESVNAIIGSPPYGIQNLATGQGVKKYAQDDDYTAWSDLMNDFCGEAWRILKPQGRLIVNIPFDVSVGGEDGGMRAVYPEFVQIALGYGFTYVTLISWDEGNISNTVARGSVDSPGAPRPINRQEAVVVFSKGKYQRSAKQEDGSLLTTDLSHEEWLDWTNAVWSIPGESNAWEGFQAAYPLELSNRLIKLFTFREDIVADLFLGSGTTAVSALLFGREFYGFEIDPLQVESAKRRINAVQKGGSR